MYNIINDTSTKERVESKSINRKIYEFASNYFHDQLIEDRPAMTKLKLRGRREDSINFFNIGVIKNTKQLYQKLLEDYSKSEIEESGLFLNEKCYLEDDEYEVYSVPIIIDGEVYTIKTKDIMRPKPERKDKYILQKYAGNNFVLGLNQDIAFLHDKFYLVEGENDLMAMWENNKMNTISILGQLKNNQIDLLKSLPPKTICIAFDNDEAGEAYTEKILRELAKTKHKIMLVKYKESDPDECFSESKKMIEVDVNIKDYLETLERRRKEEEKLKRLIESIDIEKELNAKYFKVEMSGKVVYIKKDDRLGAWSSFETLLRIYSRNMEAVKKWDKEVKVFNGTTIKYIPGLEEENGKLNLFTDFAIKPKKGNTKIIHDHIKTVICNNNEEYYEAMLNWIANMVQNPHETVRITPVLIGPESAGKGQFVEDLLMNMIGMKYCTAIRNSNSYMNNFNSLFEGKLLIFIDEASFGGSSKESGILKGYIGNSSILIERKGYESYHAPFFGHFIFSSNEKNAVRVGIGNTRYWPLEINGEWAYSEKKHTPNEIKEYFDNYNNCLKNGGREAFFYEMMNRDISQYNRYYVPTTELGKSIIRESLDKFDSWFFGALFDSVEEKYNWKYSESFISQNKLITNEAYAKYLELCKDTSGDKYDKISMFSFNEKMRAKITNIPFKHIKNKANKTCQGWQFDSSTLAELKTKYSGIFDINNVEQMPLDFINIQVDGLKKPVYALKEPTEKSTFDNDDFENELLDWIGEEKG